ncbi:MAG: PAS domain-containing sensor histidine kinase [Acidimicrobiales bacterium]
MADGAEGTGLAGTAPAEEVADALTAAMAAADSSRQALQNEQRDRQEIEAMFDLVLGAMPSAVVLVDGRGRVTRVNEAAARLCGRPGPELVGLGVEEIFGSGVPVTPWQVFDRLRGRTDRNRPYDFETGIVAADGRFVPVSVSCALLRDPDQRLFGAVYAVRDLSETHHLIQQLEQAEARWRLIAQLGDLLSRQLDPQESLEETCRWLSRSTNAGVALILTRHGVVDRVAACPPRGPVAQAVAALASHPVAPGSALARAVLQGEALHAPTLAPGFALLDDGPGPRPPSGRDFGTPGASIPRPNAVAPAIGSAALVPLAARNLVVGALLVHTEEPGGIRQRALIEQAAERVGLAVANSQLRAAVSQFEAAEEAARSREDLMAGVSHDMQTPLAVLLGTLRALEEGGERLEPSGRAQLYERMGRRGLELRRLVQQFLDYSRLGAGRPIPIRQAMTDIRFAVARTEIDVGGRRPVDISVPVDLPPAFVDADRLDQVLANLVSNAVKFSPAGSPISVIARATPDTVEIDVVDRGQGISPADLPLIFEKFRRGSGTEGIPGSGLGLYVSQAVLEAQHGRLEATSRLGEGSRFRVVLPRRPPAPPLSSK